ncbi:hypothetical protein A7X93_00725 [Stenotrophomonas maltophilia]|uniref:hypothetical protein n=1 Tax=Stenotrophomonas maltophilia TaxID=40324 RepID=UPI000DA8360B|nr:hypothetical protein [Stenotrophomonas maltophilia]PZT35161.1 hypothetical protein A7X93_00725 [Stenotrophomonas maltophilia]
MIHYLDDGVIFNRSVHSTFADRIEISADGKMNIFGAYEGVMNLPSHDGQFFFPGIDIQVIIDTPAYKPFESLAILVFFDEELIYNDKLPDEELAELKAQPRLGEADKGIDSYWLRWGGRVLSRSITEDAVIRVRVTTEDGVMAGGAFHVTLEKSE